MVKGSGTSFSFTTDTLLFSMQKSGNITNESPLVITQTFIGSNRSVLIQGVDLLPGTANFFIGENPDNWHSNLSTYGSVKYSELYPGIDLLYKGNGSVLKREFIVKPGADPSGIRMRYSGADMLSLAPSGVLNITAGSGSLTESRPVCYQDINGSRVEIGAHFILSQENELTIQPDTYNPAYPLVIDPELVYSTYLGGSGSDTGRSIIVDAGGNAYVAGYTAGSFPTTADVLQTAFGGGTWDVFVTKINPSGSDQIYSTYIGGTGSDGACDIAVDTMGNAYMTGWTGGSFPITASAYQTTYGGGLSDAFVTKLNPTGSILEYSTYLGGAAEDVGYGIMEDGGGNAYVTGHTRGSFPVNTGDYQTTYGGGLSDAFISKLDSSGSSLVISTYLGGGGEDMGRRIAVDSEGNIYVTGYTGSNSIVGNFPITAGAFQTTNGGGWYDIFVTKLHRDGGFLPYSTYLGGSGNDEAYDIAVDTGGNAYVTGLTSGSFPTLADDYQTTYGGGEYDALVTKLNPSGSSTVISTYLGGAGDERGRGIAVDVDGNILVTGITTGSFPTTPGAFQTTFGGGAGDAFVTKLHRDGGFLLYSTYFGAAGNDEGFGIAADTGGNAYVTGMTSGSFPTTAGSYQQIFGGVTDAFIGKFSFSVTCDSVGSFLNGYWYIDQDRSGTWTRRDVSSGPFGASGAIPLVNDNRLTVYNDGYWYTDQNNNGVWDTPDTIWGPFGGAPGATPLIIDGHISVFLDGYWYVDQDDDQVWTVDDAIYGPFGTVTGATPLIINERLAVFLDGVWYIDQDNSGTWTGGDVVSGPFGTAAGSFPLLVDGHLAVFLNGYWYVDQDNTGTWSGGDVSFGPFGGAPGSTPFVIHQATGSTSITEVKSAVTVPSVQTPSVTTPQSVPTVSIPERRQMSPGLAGAASRQGTGNPLEVRTLVQPGVKHSSLTP
jgi:hypothetical protein